MEKLLGLPGENAGGQYAPGDEQRDAERKRGGLRAATPAVISIALHAAALAALLIPFSLGVMDLRPRALPLLSPLYPRNEPLHAPPSRGGGGGGGRDTLPASRGALPRVARIQLTPPTAIIRVSQPVLPAQPTIISPPDLTPPQIDASGLGDPFSTSLIPSNGPGDHGGIGPGQDGGVGPRRGPGFGDDDGTGCCGRGVFHPGGDVTRPELLSRIDPEYTEEARKTKYQGSVVLSVIIQKNGTVGDVRVVRPLGMGLDEKAVAAVRQWRFRPGAKSGTPVDVIAQVEVTFRLL
jgi:TonB family protein